MKLWTDVIVSGKCKGVGDEPGWEEFISEIGVPPKSQTVEPKENEQDTKDNRSQLLQTIILQNQTKKENFQNVLLAMMNTSVTLLQGYNYYHLLVWFTHSQFMHAYST